MAEYGYAVGSTRDIVVISFGTKCYEINQLGFSLCEFSNDYLALISKFKQWDTAYHNTVFILGLPPPLYSSGGAWGVSDDVLKNEVIPKIRTVANQTGATIADFYNPMTNHPEWFNADGIHPNATGDSVIAKIAYDAIQKALNSSGLPSDLPPETPTGLKTISGLNNIILKWDANTEDDIFKYRVYRTDSQYGFQNLRGETFAPDTTYQDDNVIIDHLYYYSIDAIDLHGNISKRTSSVSGKTLDNTPPSALVNLQVMQEADTVKLTWTPNSENDLSRYYIYRNTILDDIQQASSIIGTVYAPKSDFIDISYDSLQITIMA